MALRPASITTNGSGDAFSITMDGRIMTDFTSGVPPALPGSIQTPGNPLQPFGLYIYGTSNLYDLGLYIGDDMMNQALYALYKSGGLSLDMDAVMNTDDSIFALLLPELPALYPNADINLKFRPLLPPVMLFGALDSAVADIQMGDLLLHMYVKPSGEDEILLLTVAVSMDIPITLDIPFPENSLEIAFGTPIVVVDLIAEPFIDFNDTVFDAFIPVLVEFILPVLGQMIGGIEIPTFEGWGVEVQQMFPLGQYTDYLTIWTSLISPYTDD